MEKIKTGILNDYEKGVIPKNETQITLKDVISDLKEGMDIEGAALVDESDEIIACAFSKSIDYQSEMPEILALFESLNDPNPERTHETFFAQRILDYNGFKILAKKLRDRLTLLVILKERGYLSLAMLEIENSTRRIQEILMGGKFHKTPNWT